ncbi:MAG: membrane protein insertase YidC, partial [Prevotella sp.]|nr:membrane protein insertase YidC [Prevotella sp.]
MDKNTITGFVLIALVLIGFSWWSQPSEEEQRAVFVKDSIEQVTREKAEAQRKMTQEARAAANKQKVLEDTTALFHKAFQGKAQKVVLHNSKLQLTLNSKGAAVEKVVIKGFKDSQENPNLTLFDEKDQNISYMLSAKESNISTSDLFFEPTGVTDTTVVFTAQAGEGKNIVMTYWLGQDYLLHLKMQVNGMAGLFTPNTKTMDVNWKDMCRQQEKGFTFENRYASLTWHKVDGGTDYLRETSEYKDEPIEEDFDWVAFKNQFFSAVMITKNDFKSGALATSIPQQKGSGYLKDYGIQMKTFFDPTGNQPSEFEFYYGPNDFHLLKTVEEQSTFGKELEMQDLVYLGWTIFRIINRWFTLPLFEMIAGFGINMAIVLILITLILKAITYPLVK